ncbi:MAG: class I SAM-dependent RNA methyltransferase [Anaerolineae bacterium]
MAHILELTLDAIAHGGEAIGHYAGKAIFVPYAIPSERVRVEIVEEKARWARARLMDVLVPSPDRISPPCPYFGPGRCGGCQWQHISYERQAELKQAIVADQLRRLGRIADPPVADIIALADPAAPEDEPQFLSYGYRNHVQFALTPDGQTGFRRAASHEILPVTRCLLLHELLDELHAALELTDFPLQEISLRAGINTGDALIVLSSANGEPPELELNLPAAVVLRTPAGLQSLIGDPWLTEEVLGRRYRVSAESFFQVNTVGAAALVELVTAYADAQPKDVVLDAYCGVGLFSLALADMAGRVIGIEEAPSACEDFAHNAEERDNLELHEGPVEAVLPALRAQNQRVDIAVIDPPRTGAGPHVIAELAALGPRRIVYISCDPATLARDALHLTQAGFRLREAQPVDLFPQTFHVEIVALWESLAE